MKVKGIDHLFRLVHILLLEGKPLSMVELSRRSGIERNAVWRIVSDLCELGYLQKAGYRTVEPGPGLLFLGQAAYSESFFPRLVYEELDKAEKKLGVSCALAGFFDLYLVYYYRSELNFEAWRYPLYGSNIALCILTIRDGPEKALEILRNSVETSNLSLEEKAQEIAQIRININSVLQRGYCIQTTSQGKNIAYPLCYKGKVYGLAFYMLPCSEKELGRYITLCSMLRAKLTSEDQITIHPHSETKKKQ